jgi:hypothetical protein
MRAIAVLCATLLIAGSLPGKDKEPVARVPVPPLQNGGLMSLWYKEHKYVLEEYGEFELLNLGNCGFPVATDKITATSWKLFAMGNFLNESMQYATLLRTKNHPDGILLVMFQWAQAGDTTRPHGVFYDSFIGKPTLLIRTKQSATEDGLDTLEFSCEDLDRVCGQAYYETSSGSMKLNIVDTEKKVQAKETEADEE